MDSGSGLIMWGLVASGIAAATGLIGVAIAIWVQCGRRPNLVVSANAARHILQDTWLLAVRLSLVNRSDRANTIRSVELRVGAPLNKSLRPAAIATRLTDATATVVSVDGSEFWFPHRHIKFEPLLELPISLGPGGEKKGWLLFPVSPKSGKPECNLVLDVARGKAKEVLIKFDE